MNITEEQTLSDHEIQVLITIMGRQYVSHDGRVALAEISEDLNADGFRPITLPIAINHLLNKKMITEHNESTLEEEIFGHSSFLSYSLLDQGKEWVFKNENKLEFRRNK